MARPSLAEIKERKVVQWGLAYLGGAWLLLQVAALLSAAYGWPGFVMRALPVVLAVGFLAALVVAWYHGEKGAQRVSGAELAILGGLFLLGGLGVMLLGGGADAAPEADGAGVALAGLPDPEVDQTAIAVLPFEAIGGDGIFAAGLTDELHQTLSLVPALRVTAQTSAGVFRQVSVSADSIGRALNVAHLVEGTVRTVGDRVRVAARLVNAETGQQEWSETYDRDVADVFAVQEEIARAVAAQLRVEVGSAALLDRASTTPEVFALVVQARQRAARVGPDRTGAWLDAIGLYEQALALDSTYAPGWSGMARAYIEIGFENFDRDLSWERAATYAERALALDPQDSQAHIVLAIISGFADLELTKHHMEQAVASNPTDAYALAGLGYALLGLGDEASAIRLAERVATLDPLSPDGLRFAGYIHSATGRHERAIELARAAVAVDPDDPGWARALAGMLVAAGETDEAIELAQRLVDADPSNERHLWGLAAAYARAGNRAEAERLFNAVPDTTHLFRARIEALLGDRDAAFAALDRSIAHDEAYDYGEIPTDNWLLTLHDDPRWDPLVARIRALTKSG